MEMNKKQITVIKIGLGIILLMALIPPWKCTFSTPDLPRLERPGSYGVLFHPPSPDKVANEFKTMVMSKPSFWSVELDLTRLLIQLAVVAIVTAGIVLVLKDDNRRSQNLTVANLVKIRKFWKTRNQIPSQAELKHTIKSHMDAGLSPKQALEQVALDLNQDPLDVWDALDFTPAEITNTCTQCPICGLNNVRKAFIENGSWGDYCPDCKDSLQKMRGEI